MKKINFSIYSPGGNTTALVDLATTDPYLKREVNDQIMSKYNTVEQVGFVSSNPPRLEMAGGEFCGNATRCATYKQLEGKPGSISISVSGVKQTLSAGIDTLGNCWAQMPIYSSLASITTVDSLFIVKLQGITQVVCYCKTPPKTQKIAKSQAIQILRSLKLDITVKAAGVMFVTKKESISLEPVVWVRAIKTLFYETACASGTTAVALVEAKNKAASLINLPVIQPSGLALNVSVTYSKNKFVSALISGPVNLLFDDFIYV